MLLRSNDYIFYPLIAIAAAAMIAVPLVLTAADRVGAAENIREDGIDITGERLQSLAVAEGLAVQFLSDETGAVFARITANVDRLAPTAVASAGVFDALRPYEVEAVSGYDLRVIFTLQTARENAASQVDAGFFMDGIGQSGWRRVELAADRQEFELSVDVPYCNPNFAFAGLWPNAGFEANVVDLYAIRIETTGEADCTNLAD